MDKLDIKKKETDDFYVNLWILVISQIFKDITSRNKYDMPYNRRLDIVKTMLNGGYDWLDIDGRALLIKWFKQHPKYYDWYKEDLEEWMHLLN